MLRHWDKVVVDGDPSILTLTADGDPGIKASGSAEFGLFTVLHDGAISIIDSEDEHGGTIREINAVTLWGDTVRPNVLLEGYTAHNAYGEPIVGTLHSAEYPTYTGVTLVTPLADTEQVLDTAQKLLLDDITVEKIPYTEVTNLSGGLTVSIG